MSTWAPALPFLPWGKCTTLPEPETARRAGVKSALSLHAIIAGEYSEGAPASPPKQQPEAGGQQLVESVPDSPCACLSLHSPAPSAEEIPSPVVELEDEAQSNASAEADKRELPPPDWGVTGAALTGHLDSLLLF